MKGRPVVLTFPHDVGAQEARRRAHEASEKLVTQYSQFLAHRSIVWTGNHADFEVGTLGMTFRGMTDIAEDHVTIKVLVPMVLLPWRQRIEDFLKSNAPTLGLPKPK